MIVVTPGHYAGAVGARFDKSFTEYPETRKWARKLYQAIGEQAMYVGASGLTRKVNAVNELCLHNDVKLAIEVHFNSAKDSNGAHVGEGSETLYCPGSTRGKALAKKVQAVLAEFFPPNRGVKEGYYRRRKTSGPLYFLEKTRCPAIIIEPQFVQFHKDIEARRNACCTALAAALLRI